MIISEYDLYISLYIYLLVEWVVIRINRQSYEMKGQLTLEEHFSSKYSRMYLDNLCVTKLYIGQSKMYDHNVQCIGNNDNTPWIRGPFLVKHFPKSSK
jgi:hypothetical protein